jgi:hypothetical protein
VKRNLLVSVSGGRSSHFMAKHLREHPDYRDCNLLFAFGNTGKERAETLDFVHECEVHWSMPIVWLEAKVNPEYRKATTYTVVNYETAARNGEPFEAMIQKYGIPNQSYPHCTRELKLRPIQTYARDYFRGEPYMTAIGIRVDEARRIKIDPDKCYPLVEWGVNVERVRRWWQEQPFDLKLKDYEGNCDLCWKKSTRKLMTLIKERPQDAAWWAEMEDRYGQLRLDTRENEAAEGKTMRFNRKSLPVHTLVEAAQQPFTPITDPFWESQRTEALDDEQPCACMLQEEDAA